MRNKEKFLLIVILILSFIIRWKDIERLPYGIEGDEFSEAIATYLNRYDVPSSEKGIWGLHDALIKRFPVYPKFFQLSYLIFEVDLLSPRKLVVFLSVFSLFFFYLISRQFLSKKIALITLFLYSLSTYKLIISRVVFQYPFSDVFVFPTMALALALSFKNTRSYLYVLITSIGISLSLLTYNLAYMIPSVAFVILGIRAVKEKISIKKSIILLIIFLLPLACSSGVWLQSLQQEYLSKDHALGHNVINLKGKKLDLKKLSDNYLQIKNMLFYKLSSETSDMLVSYPSTLINKIISYAFISGFVIALIKFKKFYPLIIWLLFQGIAYYVLFGLYLPRMWFLTIGIIYIFFGISLEFVIDFISKFSKHIKLILYSILTISLIKIIFQDITIYYKYAINNSSYKISLREIADLVKKNRIYIGKNIYVVSNEVFFAETNNAILSFYYLAENPNRAILLKTLTRQDLGSFTKQEILDSNIVNSKSIIITDNESLDSIVNLIKEKNVYPSYSVIKYQYYSEIIPVSKTPNSSSLF